MRERKSACLTREMEHLSTEQLDEMLQKELQKEMPSEKVVLPILKELRQRETNRPMVDNTMPETQEVRQEHTTDPGKTSGAKKRSWIIKAAAVAAVVAVVVCAIPFTGGAESALDVLYRLTDSVIEFFRSDSGENDDVDEYVFETDHPGLQQVYDAVVELGVTEPVVPTWLPEGYVLAELEKAPTPGGVRLYATFVNEGKAIIIQFRIAEEAFYTQYERADGIEVFESDGKKHLVYQNMDDRGVVWVTDSAECMISAEAEADALYKIVDSIYRRK